MSRDTLVSLALALLTVAVFARVRDHGFINYDDPGYVHEAHVRRGLTAENVRWAFTTLNFSNYHPLTWLSHMADVEMFGHDPRGHHLVNVALHAANAAALYLLLLAMTRNRWASLAVAAVWAVHPLRVESVAWVAERKDLLSGLFFLLTLACYTRYARRGSRAAYAASLACFTLGLLSKPMLVTLPCVLLLLDFWPLKRAVGWRRLIVEKLPFFALTMASAVITVIAQRQGGAMSAGEAYPLSLRLGNALWAYGRYVELTFWPRGLAIIYPHQGALPGTSLSAAGVAAGAALLVGVTLLGIWLWRRRGERAVLVGWLWFVGMLVPVIGIVQVGWQSMADRYTYLPHIGLLIATVALVRMLLERFPGRGRAVIGTAATAAVVVGLSGRTYVELGHWRNSITLFTRALAVTSNNHVAHSGLALAYDEAGRPQDAIREYERALAITPDVPQLHYNIGRLYLLQENWDLAERWSQQAVDRDPKHVDALIHLGKARVGQKRHEAAVEAFRRALEVDPNSTMAHYDLAVELAQNKRIDEALPHFAEAIRTDPDTPQLHYGYSLALRQAGRPAEAETAYQRYAELARRQGVKPLPNHAVNPDNRTR